MIPRARFDAFSDGVFAIVITLMVLELRLPEIEAEASAELLSAYAPLVPVLAAYLASFATLASFWLSHGTLTAALPAVPRRCAVLNLAFFFFVCLVPFPTALIGRYGLLAAVVVPFAVILLCASSLLGLLRLRILEAEGASGERLQVQRRRIAISAGVYLLGIALASAEPVSGAVALVGFSVVMSAPLAYRLVGREAVGPTGPGR